MNMGVTHRVFLSILLATLLAVLCIFLIMQWSINRGFLQYLSALDQGRLEYLAEKLGESYADYGGWDFLRRHPRHWIMRLMAERPNDDLTSDHLRELRQGNDVPPFQAPMGGRQGPRLRFVILDEDRKPIFGNPAETEDLTFRAIVRNGRAVGYVGVLSPRHFLSPPQLEFLKQQKSALILAALGMVLVVVIISLPLATHLVRPIKAMAEATRSLASGNYLVRVPVSSNDELGRLARDFNAMALTLERNEKARRQWVADISHELRTPLSVLRGEIEALLEGIRPTTPDAIRSLHAETLRLHRLVDDLYQLALSDLGTTTYRKEDLNLGQVLRDSIEPYHTECDRKGITLTTEIPQGSECTLFADPERLQQLFSNLLDNSLKYTDAGGKLLVRLVCREGRAEIDVEDSAPGVPEGELEKLFDRLYRVEVSRSRSSGGAGLGLSICRNIAEAHSGSISAHPSSLGGVMMKVTLPVEQCR